MVVICGRYRGYFGGGNCQPETVMMVMNCTGFHSFPQLSNVPINQGSEKQASGWAMEGC